MRVKDNETRQWPFTRENVQRFGCLHFTESLQQHDTVLVLGLSQDVCSCIMWAYLLVMAPNIAFQHFQAGLKFLILHEHSKCILLHNAIPNCNINFLKKKNIYIYCCLEYLPASNPIFQSL